MGDLFPLLGLDGAERLDRLCDQFEERRKAGDQAEIEAWLEQVEPRERGALLFELVRVERELCGATWREHEVNAWCARFPDYAAVVEAALESVQISTVAEPVTPKQIGRFEVLGTLGKGAFGVVYKALDPELERVVALKMPRSGVLRNAGEKQQFLLEARAAANLRHPNVCPIFEVGELEGRPFIVMACINGRSLAEVIKLSPRSNERSAAGIALDLARGLAEAHSKGIVHRDLKPANVLLDENGVAVITDFGLAADLRRGTDIFDEPARFLGTPAYMAPEQVKRSGQKAEAADIYSLGVILYELLAGARPFEGSVPEVLRQILEYDGRQPLAGLRDADPRLADICHKAMAPCPADRYASMSQFAVALDDYLEKVAEEACNGSSGSSVDNNLRTPRRRSAALAAAALLAAALPFFAAATVRSLSSPSAPDQAASTTAGDPERAMAEWLLEIGASFRIDVAGQSQLIERRGALPAGPLRITIVNLDGQSELKEADFERLKSLNSLGSLICSGTGLTNLELRQLASMDQLQGLVLDQTAVTDDGLQLLAGMKKLNTLSLNNAQVFGDGFRHLEPLPTLQRLSLAGNRLQPAAYEHLSRLTQLEYLTLDRTATSDSDLKWLGQLEGLVALELCDTQIRGEGLHHLARLKSLKRLRLDRTQISDDSLVEIAKLTSLEALVLDGTLVTGKGLKNLKPLTHLRSLSLNHAKVGRYALESLQALPSLTDLSLWAVAITDASVEPISRLKGLQRLNLGRTQITPEGFNRLQQALPECVIER